MKRLVLALTLLLSIGGATFAKEAEQRGKPNDPPRTERPKDSRQDRAREADDRGTDVIAAVVSLITSIVARP